MTLQNVSVELQKELLVRGGHMSEAEADEHIYTLMEKYNSRVTDYIEETLSKAQVSIDKQLGRKK